jgi:hypothetical protein
VTAELIKSWSDLPSEYRQMYLRTSSRYRAARIYTNPEADRRAFEDTRALYWSRLKTMQQKQPDTQPRLM